MRLNTEENLQRFLTNSKSSTYHKLTTNTSPNYIQNINTIHSSSKAYPLSKSNKNIPIKDIQNKRFSLFSKLSSRQKEKMNISKFLKSKKKYFNNINLLTEGNQPKKNSKKEELNSSNLSKGIKTNNYKTLNYEQTPYGRIMKYFTIKSSNKPMKFDELSQVFVPIRNTLSNEHRNKNNKINTKKTDNVRDKMNIYYLNSKDKIIQLFKNNKLEKKIINKKNNTKKEKEQKNKSENKATNNKDKEIKCENDINYNMNTIDNNMDGNNNKESKKNPYQFRIRKINVPSGIDLATIQSNNKLLHNLLNRKSKTTRMNNFERINTDYNAYNKLK